MDSSQTQTPPEVGSSALLGWLRVKLAEAEKSLRAREQMAESCERSADPAYHDAGGYDHDEVRCEAMEDADCDTLPVGSPRTCCVCAGHDCIEAKAERAKHPIRPNGAGERQPAENQKP